MKGRARMIAAVLAVAGLSAVVVLGATATANTHKVAARATHSPSTGPTNCGLRHNTKHVVYLIFDNVHFLRDNPNVPSDLEQMPHLLNFIRGNGTLLTNDHTVLISHTGNGILTSLTGMYSDRHGQAVAAALGHDSRNAVHDCRFHDGRADLGLRLKRLAIGGNERDFWHAAF